MPIERTYERELRLNLYRTGPPLNLLAFDDPRGGLKGELFVPSATAVLDDLAAAVFGEARDVLTVAFDSKPFEGWQTRAVKVDGQEDEELREELGIDAKALTDLGQYAVATGAGTYYRIDAACVGNAGSEIIGKVLWLCPALHLYFPDSPRTLYVRLDPVAPEGKRLRGGNRAQSTSEAR